MKKKFYWRKLDSQAKVFSLASNNKYHSVFRLSIVLNEKIEEKILQKALEFTLDKYQAYKVKLLNGVFWQYLEVNNQMPVVTMENEYPFRKVNTKENNDYLFKVTYFNNKINIDFYHALTDGNSGIEFLKDIVYRYLELKHPNKLNQERLKEKITILDSENAYENNYKKHIAKKTFSSRAYMIKGDKLEEGKVGITHFNIDLNEIKKCSREKLCGLSVFIVAMIGYSIYESTYKNQKNNKPINLCIPIGLKKYFETNTLSNFFSHMMINLKLKKDRRYKFEDIIFLVKEEFEKKSSQEKIISTMCSIVESVNNPIVRIMPLFLKKIMIRIGSLEFKKHITMTVSNLGIIEVDNKYSDFIKQFFTMLGPDWAEKIKCGICSYKNNLVVTFGTKLNNCMLEKEFQNILEKNNIKYTIEGNEINVIS